MTHDWVQLNEKLEINLNDDQRHFIPVGMENGERRTFFVRSQTFIKTNSNRMCGLNTREELYRKFVNLFQL